MSKDPYQILKVHPRAKLEEIKKAYRKLVKIHHPDKGGDAAVMLEVNSACLLYTSPSPRDRG